MAADTKNVTFWKSYNSRWDLVQRKVATSSDASRWRRINRFSCGVNAGDLAINSLRKSIAAAGEASWKSALEGEVKQALSAAGYTQEAAHEFGKNETYSRCRLEVKVKLKNPQEPRLGGEAVFLNIYVCYHFDEGEQTGTHPTQKTGTTWTFDFHLTWWRTSRLGDPTAILPQLVTEKLSQDFWCIIASPELRKGFEQWHDNHKDTEKSSSTFTLSIKNPDAKVPDSLNQLVAQEKGIS